MSDASVDDWPTRPVPGSGAAGPIGERTERMNEHKTTVPDDYDSLPEAIKTVVGRREWAWLSDAEKATLVQRECEPDE